MLYLSISLSRSHKHFDTNIFFSCSSYFNVIDANVFVSPAATVMAVTAATSVPIGTILVLKFRCCTMYGFGVLTQLLSTHFTSKIFSTKAFKQHFLARAHLDSTTGLAATLVLFYSFSYNRDKFYNFKSTELMVTELN